MNRYQSNPFLSDLDDAVGDAESTSNATGQDQPSAAQISRRHSSSHPEGPTESSIEQRLADRRLYHRNMSSFEAASLQLERQQHLQENGSTTESHTNQEDLTTKLTKMIADFESAISSNDEQFKLDGSDNPINLNPFDPFETIVDDDVSLPSSATNSGQIQQVFVLHKEQPEEEEDSLNIDRVKKMETTVEDGELVVSKAAHDSIDDDEAELVSTPVRNIKSSPNRTVDNNVPVESQISNKQSSTVENTCSGPSDEGHGLSSDSFAKASLFASVLATEGSASGQQITPDASDPIFQASSQESQPVNVIKGSATYMEGYIDSSVGLFDPFETVIDKDALGSLTSEVEKEVDDEATTDGHSSTEERLNDDKFNSQRIDHGGTPPDAALEDTQKINNFAIPRPKANLTPNDDVTVAQTSISTPARRAKKEPTVKKRVNNVDSSDSSEEDDRIQIVIKAHKDSDHDISKGPAIVPLLPPPPSKSSMKQARERGQVTEMPSSVLTYKKKYERDSSSEDSNSKLDAKPGNGDADLPDLKPAKTEESEIDEYDDDDSHGGEFVIPMTLSDTEDGQTYGKSDTPLYDDDTSYVLEDYPTKYEGSGWEMLLRYPPKKKLTANRYWKKIFVKLAEVPVVPMSKSNKTQDDVNQTCIALQVYDNEHDKKAMQEIPIQATYTVSDISTQQFDQFGKIFTIKLQYIFYKEKVGVRQGQLARFIHTGHIGSSTTSGGHGVDPISIGSIKRMGAPIEHSPQISQIIKLGCNSYEDIKQFKNCLEDHLFGMSISRDRALSIYKTEEVQMAVRDETYLELNQVGTIVRQLARVRLFFLSFLNGMPLVEVGINDIHRQGREVVGRMDILPVVTEEWIRLEACELHSTVDKDVFDDPDLRIIKLSPPDATFFELMRFRIRPPRNRELPLQVSANMTVTRTKVGINCEVIVPGCVSRKHGQIPCENIAIRVAIPECWIYFFREEKHFRMGSKKSVNRRPGKVKGIERFLGGGGLQDINDDSSLIEVTSGQAKYEHHHSAIVWRAARWPKESQSAYVQNTMKIRLPLSAYDKMPENFYEYVHVEYSMPATTVSHTTLRSISVNPCDDEPPEKYVKYSAKYEYKVKMRLAVNLSSKSNETKPESSPIVIMRQPDATVEREDDESEEDEHDDRSEGAN